MSNPDNGDNVLVRFDRLVRETESAVLIRIDDEDYWIPLSQIADINDREVWIPLWLAEKKGLEYE